MEKIILIILAVIGYFILCIIENWIFESDYEKVMGYKLECLTKYPKWRSKNEKETR